MKKFILIMAVAILFSGSLAFAEDQGMMGNSGGEDQGMMMGGPQGQGEGRGKMNPMMMKGMMQKDSLVATSDGGVVVLSGPRLLKYDANLTLVKEVELPKGKPPARPEGQNGQDAQAGDSEHSH